MGCECFYLRLVGLPGAVSIVDRTISQEACHKTIEVIILNCWSRNATVMIKRTKVKRKLPANSEQNHESPKKKKIAADETLDSFKQVRL